MLDVVELQKVIYLFISCYLGASLLFICKGTSWG